LNTKGRVFSLSLLSTTWFIFGQGICNTAKVVGQERAQAMWIPAPCPLREYSIFVIYQCGVSHCRGRHRFFNTPPVFTWLVSFKGADHLNRKKSCFQSKIVSPKIVALKSSLPQKLYQPFDFCFYDPFLPSRTPYKEFLGLPGTLLGGSREDEVVTVQAVQFRISLIAPLVNPLCDCGATSPELYISYMEISRP